MDSQPEALPRRTILKGAVALGGVALLPACGTDEPSSAGLTLEDQRGKKLTLDGPAKRIVTLPMPAASIMIAVDRTADHVVGIHDASWAAAKQSILGTMFPEVLKVQHDVGTQDFAPNVEGILALKPDIVVQWASQGEEIITPLENADLTVLGVNYGTIKDVGEWFRMFSTVLGKPERGRAMSSRLDAGRAAIEAVAARQSARAPRVLYFLRFSEGMEVQGAGTFNEEYIRLVGAENVSSDVKGLARGGPRTGAGMGPEASCSATSTRRCPRTSTGTASGKRSRQSRTRRVYGCPRGIPLGPTEPGVATDVGGRRTSPSPMVGPRPARQDRLRLQVPLWPLPDAGADRRHAPDDGNGARPATTVRCREKRAVEQEPHSVAEGVEPHDRRAGP